LVAHRSALEANGATTLVLAEGILNFRLKSEIKSLVTSQNLIVLSEFSPRLPWSGRNAMTRNRTICGLAEAMVLVESGAEGGTFECGKTALELRRALFVVEYAEPPVSAAGNAYFLTRGGRPLRRNRAGQPNLDDIIKAATEHLTPAQPPHEAHPLLAGLAVTKTGD
jgi:predicted Rossmann fold nucleotide-binding protein DprA/Smf involved in DNA uptake